MKCSATKRNGLPCTFKAKVNGHCGIHKLKPIPKTRGLGLGQPTTKPRVKKAAFNEQLNRPIPKPCPKQRPIPKPRLKQRPIPPPCKKKLQREAEHTPANHVNKRNKFLREWRMEQIAEYNAVTTFLRDLQSWTHRILQNELMELNSLNSNYQFRGN